MKQPVLFDVPKDSPTWKERLDAFKKLHGIVTHDCDMDTEPWVAALMPKVYTLGYGVEPNMSIGLCFAHVGRLIEDAGYCAYGKTEREAVLNLCKQNGIEFIL